MNSYNKIAGTSGKKPNVNETGYYENQTLEPSSRFWQRMLYRIINFLKNITKHKTLRF